MNEYVHLTPEQADRLEKVNAENVAALSVQVRVKGLWQVKATIWVAIVARLLGVSNDRVTAWVNAALARCRAQTRIARRGKWSDAGPIEMRMEIPA